MKSHFLKHTEKPKNCPFADCDSVLKNANVLRMHIKKIHNKVNPWADKMISCDVCNTKLRAKNLAYHRKTRQDDEKNAENKRSLNKTKSRFQVPKVPADKSVQKVTTYKRYKDEEFHPKS